MAIDTVILAGTNKKNLIYGKNKFFLDIDGKKVGDYIIDACLKSIYVGNIVVVAPKEAKEEFKGLEGRVTFIEERKSFLQNCLAGYEGIRIKREMQGEPFRKNDPLLYVTSDVPLITKESINYFVLESLKVHNSVYIPHVPMEELNGFCPYFCKPMILLKEGRFKEGNIMLIRPEDIQYKELIQESYDLRKQMKVWNNLLLLGRIIKLNGFRGAAQLSRMMAKRMCYSLVPGQKKLENNNYYRFIDKIIPDMSRANIEERLSKIMECSVKIITTPYKELSFDIDSVKDYEIMKENFAKFSLLVYEANQPRKP